MMQELTVDVGVYTPISVDLSGFDANGVDNNGKATKGTVTEDEAMSNFYKYINEKYPTIVTP